MSHSFRMAGAAVLVLAIALLAGCEQASESESFAGSPALDQAGPAQAAAAAAVCEHGMADARCPFCHPGLIEQMGMCGGHGIPEAICFPCWPELEVAFRAVGDWCGGHDRPESQCYICNPQLDPNRQAATPDQASTPATDNLIPVS